MNKDFKGIIEYEMIDSKVSSSMLLFNRAPFWRFNQPYNKFLYWNASIQSDTSGVMKDMMSFSEGNSCILTERSRVQNNPIAVYSFYNIYPVSITKLLSFENRSTPQKFSIEFNYEFYTFMRVSDWVSNTTSVGAANPV